VPAGTGLAYAALLISAGLLGQHSYWGWRAPFLISVLLVGIGLYVRLGVLETPAFTRLREEHRIERVPLVEAFRLHWREVVLSALSRLGQLAPFYIFNTFVLTYGTAFSSSPSATSYSWSSLQRRSRRSRRLSSATPPT
jgi:MFS family permease